MFSSPSLINNYTTPLEVADRHQISQSLNRYILINPKEELAKTRFNLKFTFVQKSTLYKTAYRVSLIAIISISLIAMGALALYASTYLFTFIAFYGLGCYLVCPKVARFLKTKELRAALHESNVKQYIQELEALQSLSKKDLEKLFFDAGVNVKHFAPVLGDNRLLTESEAISLLLPLLAKYRFWIFQLVKAHTYQTELKEQLSTIRNQILKDDQLTVEQALKNKVDLDNKLREIQNLAEEEKDRISVIQKDIERLKAEKKLSKGEKNDLIKKGIVLFYQIEALEQGGSFKGLYNSKLTSAIKAAYILEILQNPTEQRSLQQLGSFNLKYFHTRQIYRATQTGDGYFILKNNTTINLTELSKNALDIEWIRNRLFQKGPRAKQQPA